MSRCAAADQPYPLSFPRVSGDEPRRLREEKLPGRFPRVSGDEPARAQSAGPKPPFSPRERG